MPLARALETIDFLVLKAVLPCECTVHRDVILWHHGLGTVMHFNTVIGQSVRCSHNVPIAAGTWHIGDETSVVIEDGVSLGVGSLIIG